jgi:hypothetical protein
MYTILVAVTSAGMLKLAEYFKQHLVRLFIVSCLFVILVIVAIAGFCLIFIH